MRGTHVTEEKKRPMTLPPPKDAARIEYMPLSKMKQWPGNPKEHDVEAIRASIRRFGFVTPLVLDEKSGRMVAGHGRLEALLLEQKEGAGKVPPKKIVIKNKEWHVPVLRGLNFKTEAEAEAYLIASNRLPEIGGWVPDKDMREFMGKHAKSEASLRSIGYLPEEYEAMKVELPDPPKTPVEFETKQALRQIIITMAADKYEEAYTRLRRVAEKNNMTSNTEAVLLLLQFYAGRTKG